MSNEIKIPFTTLQSEEKYNTLIINVYHHKAGYSGFDYTFKPGAVRLSFNPCSIDGGIRRSVLMSGDQWKSGFFIVLKPLERSNPHYIKRALAVVESLASDIRDAYESKDIEKLQSLSKSIADKAEKK